MVEDVLERGSRSSVAIEGRDVPALVFRPSQRRQLLFAAAALGISVLGALAISVPPYDARDAIALVGVVALGVVGLLRVRRLRRGGEFLALTAQGIAQASWLGGEFIAWDDIRDVQVESVGGTKLIVIRGQAKSESQLRNVIRAVDRSATRWDLAIGAASLGLPAEPLRDAIVFFVESEAQRSRFELVASS